MIHVGGVSILIDGDVQICARNSNKNNGRTMGDESSHSYRENIILTSNGITHLDHKIFDLLERNSLCHILNFKILPVTQYA